MGRSLFLGSRSLLPGFVLTALSGVVLRLLPEFALLVGLWVPWPGRLSVDRRVHGCAVWPCGGWSWTWLVGCPPRPRPPPGFSPASPRVYRFLVGCWLAGLWWFVPVRCFLPAVPAASSGLACSRLVVILSGLCLLFLCLRFTLFYVSRVRVVLVPGSWFTSLGLFDTFWLVPVPPRFRSCLAVGPVLGCSASRVSRLLSPWLLGYSRHPFGWWLPYSWV